MKILLPVLVLIAIGCAAHASLVPVIANSGFEQPDTGWGWQVFNGRKSSIRYETANPHSGKRCLALIDESPLAPNVYGRLSQNVSVIPDTDYEISVWVRGEGVEGSSGPSHLTDWGTYVLNLPSGNFGWQRVSTTFRTKPGQNLLTLGLNMVNKCKELAIDDIALRPMGTALKGDGIDGSILATGKVVGHDTPGFLAIWVTSTRPGKPEVEAVITANGKEVFRKRARVKPGDNLFDWEWSSGRAPFGMMDCAIRVVENGKTTATADTRIEKVQSPILAAIDLVDARMKEFNDLYAKLRAKHIALDYPTVAKTTLEQFIPLARQDAKTGEERRAEFAVKDFNRTLDNSIAEMKAYLADPKLAPNARRYQTGKVTIDGLSLIGDRKTRDGERDRGPVFFCGYGHFSGVRIDMPRWPGYGINIIQFAEFGPSAVLPGEDKVDLKPVKTLIAALDDAAKHNVRVDFLLSPHYFPAWALQKWPALGCGGGGWLGFCVDAPEAKQVIEKFLRIVIPMIKDKPALNSFCLSNEPSFENTAGCPVTKEMWAAYLEKTHGTVAAMNEHYITKYVSFADVPIPGNQSFNEPQYYDWCYFNEQRFAAWHAWEAGICHELAPGIPVHAKIQVFNTLFRDIISYGVSPEMFGALSDLNGNDCIFVDNPGPGWAVPWMVQNVSYDIQRSLNNKPIFNSENHPTIDGSTAYIPPDYFRTCLWLGALRGQSATTIWVWERMEPGNAPSIAFLGNVMDRPGCAEAVGKTCLDLNRFADEMAALQRAPSPVAILFSVASIAKHADYLGNMEAAYTALNFCGIKVDFISEKQLNEGKGKQYKMIVLPDATNVMDSTVDALARLPESVRLVCIGDSLAKDQYNRPRTTANVEAVRSRSLAFKSWSDPEKVLWPALRDELEKLGGLPDVRLVDAAAGVPVWGVEWLPAKVGGRTVISILDLRSEPKEVQVRMRGKTIEAKDLLSLGGRENIGALKPMVPVLAQCE